MDAAVVEHIRRVVKNGNLEGLSASKFYELGVHLNEGLGREGYSALHWACHYGKAEVVQHLLELGASVAMVTKQGWTAAHVCAIKGCGTCLQILCSAGVDLSAKDKRGYSCAHLAAVHGRCGVLQVLLKVGVSMQEEEKGRRAWTVLHHAAFHGRLGILQLLLKLPEIDSTVEDRDGNSPAHLAATEGHLDCLRLLVYHKKQPMDAVSARNNDGSTPKDLAIRFHKKDCVEFLELAESEVDELDYKETGEFPAHAAARDGNLQLLSMLIKEGHCGINDRDQNGSTPAHKACGNAQTECLQWLIDHGADMTLTNEKGETPREVAIRFSSTGCIAILAPHIPHLGTKGQWEGEEAELDEPSGISVGRAKQRVEKLVEALQTAKLRFRELGGELPEDREIELLKAEHQKVLSEADSRLQYERKRRETLEAEMDQLRKQLQEAMSQLKKFQAVSSSSSLSPFSTPDHPQTFKSKQRKAPKKIPPGGGAFIKIGHV